MGNKQTSTAHLTAHVKAQGLGFVQDPHPMWDTDIALDSPERYYVACSGVGLWAAVITTADAGVVCGLASQLVVPSGARWTADAEAVIFDDRGPHFPAAGCTTAVWLSSPDRWHRGPRWGGDVGKDACNAALYAGGLLPQKLAHCVGARGVTDSPCAVPHASYPTWLGITSKDGLRIKRLQIFRFRKFRVNYH